jgi:serine/threonine protein phosphatase PrpC
MVKIFFSEYFLDPEIYLYNNEYNNNDNLYSINANTIGNCNNNIIINTMNTIKTINAYDTNTINTINNKSIYNNSNSIMNNSNISNSNINNSNISNNDNNLNTNPNFSTDLIYKKLTFNKSQLIKHSFNLCEEYISLSKYDINFSGSTCVLLFILNNKIICGNTGDSRAILITTENKNDGNNEIIGYGYENFNQNKQKDYIVNLSRDHKPELEDELNRIHRCNGRVDKYNDNGVSLGPYRVWLKNQNYPGLAMSRSIGDLVAGSVGVICDPEIIEYEINEFCKFIVIASDGVWEFLSNEKVMEIVNKFYYNNLDSYAAAEKVIEEATKMWRKVKLIIF